MVAHGLVHLRMGYTDFVLLSSPVMHQGTVDYFGTLAEMFIG